jgi:hypothetical protein
MATTNMKRIVANALADYIGANVAGLSGLTSAVIAGPEVVLPCLAVRVIPQGLKFEPAQEDEVYETDVDDGNVITDVGSWTGQFNLELYTTSPAEREVYEQAITDLFMQETWAPGTLFLDTPALTVNGYISLYSAEAKLRLTDEDWNDEMAFEAKRYCYLTVDVDLPVLVNRLAHNLDIQLVFSNDFDAVITDRSQVDPTDQVDVNDDGTVTRAT